MSVILSADHTLKQRNAATRRNLAVGRGVKRTLSSTAPSGGK